MYKIIDEKGRLTIPEAVRNRLGLQCGTIVSLKECGSCLAVHPEKVCDHVAMDCTLFVFEQKSPEKLTCSVIAPSSHKAKIGLCGSPCGGETPDSKVLEAFDALSPAEKKAVMKRLKGCEGG